LGEIRGFRKMGKLGGIRNLLEILGFYWKFLEIIGICWNLEII
jgi:hypothetical protein